MSDALTVTLEIKGTPSGESSFNPFGKKMTYSTTYDEDQWSRSLECTGATLTVDLGHLTDISFLFIQNLDDAIDVVTGTLVDADANEITMRIPPGRFAVIPDCAAGASDLVITADSGTPLVRVGYVGT